MAAALWMARVISPPVEVICFRISGTALAGQAVIPAWAGSNISRSLWPSPMAKQRAAGS